MPRKIRASKDEETQTPLSQRPEFIIGMTFLAVVAAVIISVLIFRFIWRRKAARKTAALEKAAPESMGAEDDYARRLREEAQKAAAQKINKKLNKIIEETTGGSGPYPGYTHIMTYENGDQYDIFVKITLDGAGNEMKKAVVKKNYIPDDDYNWPPKQSWGIKGDTQAIEKHFSG